MNVELLEYPTDKDWMEVKRRALVTFFECSLRVKAAPTIIPAEEGE